MSLCRRRCRHCSCRPGAPMAGPLGFSAHMDRPLCADLPQACSGHQHPIHLWPDLLKRQACDGGSASRSPLVGGLAENRHRSQAQVASGASAGLAWPGPREDEGGGALSSGLPRTCSPAPGPVFPGPPAQFCPSYHTFLPSAPSLKVRLPARPG